MLQLYSFSVLRSVRVSLSQLCKKGLYFGCSSCFSVLPSGPHSFSSDSEVLVERSRIYFIWRIRKKGLWAFKGRS
jgi:hypothetical protein